MVVINKAGITRESPFYGVVDHVFLQACTKYPKRIESAGRELRRVGILDYNCVMQHSNPIERMLWEHIEGKASEDSGTWASIWMGHYHIVKTCYDLGYDRVMVVEDDVSFLNDLATIRVALNDTAGRDFLLLDLDPIVVSKKPYEDGIALGRSAGLRFWGINADTSGTWMHGTGCSILSRAAIEAYVRFHESYIDGFPDRHTQVTMIDMCYPRLVADSGKPILYAVPNLSVQYNMTGDNGERGICTGICDSTYRSIGLDLSKYKAI